MPSDRLMRAACSLAARGLYVFPLRPGSKIPAVRRDWEGCATTDVEQIERWWLRAPYNIGVATGPSRLLVVDLDAPKRSDLDRRHGRQVLDELARKAHETVPRNTLIVTTAGGGQHLYFRAPTDRSLTNTAGRLGPHIDTRARGGYVVGPGSRSGRSLYRIVHGTDPVPAPQWIVALLQPSIPPCPPRRETPHPAYVRAAIEGEMRRVAEATPGRRNATLFKAAARLGRFVHSGQVNDGDVDAALSTAASGHVGIDGFSPYEIRRTIRSGIARSVQGAGNRRGADPMPPQRSRTS
ncbi:bifunctional DNA primase/polymerase-like protein [Pseudonocardia sediminis]|uniref:Bifunctional DNA primase/polymerase-like protein n=1 Tax=Pseudonocardia sediminis TaxID=1397368 RepID=A0A4Q7UZD9_PSEST|nr:bifunctional DNA primase/polymerase [Pseudonocardia sediminis]RZT85569.1 bifunctional DNA primase/polymerase-like protein [Pseudonocardia sediminis]